MASGSLYVLELKGIGQGQNFLNVFHYLQTSGSDGAPQLSARFYTVVMPRIMDVTSLFVTYTEIAVRDKVDPTDFYSLSISDEGNRAGSILPTHDALSYTYKVNRLDCRSGGKRFAGVSESDVQNGVIVPPFVTEVTALEVALEQQQVQGGSTWRPVIYGKRTGSSGYFTNPLSSVVFLGVTTQNTRKFYTSPGL